MPVVLAEMNSYYLCQMLIKINTRKEQDPELHAASISAGLYMCNIGDSFDECYTKADKALYFVKQNGKSDFSFHEK